MQNDIDRLLTDEDKVTPSSKFLESVMAAVEREAAARRPIEFPWFRALPGIVAMIVALAVAMWSGIGALNEPGTIVAVDERVLQLTVFATGIGLHWILLATLITVVSVILPSSLMNIRNSARPLPR
ncbi:MAG: hypothetical protein GXP15_10650 [Gammaproteobacteria bacterium]|nr:hypothetical protein [Gammaproteobacteria bacterium]